MAIESVAWLVAAGMDWAQAQGLPNMVFFQEINGFLDDEIGEFAGNLLGRVVTVAGSAALTLLTFWILVQGYRIATGLSREPMMALVGDALKAVLVIGIATGAAAGAGSTARSWCQKPGWSWSGPIPAMPYAPCFYYRCVCSLFWL